MKPFKRKLREQLAIRVTIYDGTGARQSVSGVSDLRVNIFALDMTPIVTDDHAHCVIDETGVENVGDVRYSAPPGTVPTRGRYLMEFICTIAGEPVAFPEEGYISLTIN